ncbi:hypothetical protein FDI21_gp023 [Pseudomonas phage Noxifer]|uniref:Uncharacterized protein n=1 Tax=Pseudomonas phage Noxifer TaxID=2006684 RepID=A0A1Y0SX65_9CAUD|nr:hypothetical protein FDI21_gp023 [Pseudomonas phage Noxifer]ARV77194.1 hypothetical protein NOXIFER_23 [Pseudomonas phage Noxifer]
MATAQTQSTPPKAGTPGQAQATERKPQSQLVSTDIAAATNGFAGDLEAAAASRIQYS